MVPIHEAFLDEWNDIVATMFAMAEGRDATPGGSLRGRANDFVLRATQAALTAAKGAGFVAGHDVGRWCREAMFFLVWSCPRSVTSARLCELSQFD